MDGNGKRVMITGDIFRKPPLGESHAAGLSLIAPDWLNNTPCAAEPQCLLWYGVQALFQTLVLCP